ncbi:MAG: BACON domain-containing protein [Lachnospiraceae bacterium]|nr:BACON domain-containing protein [Lachnospiraceae bacterium]
MKNIIIFTILLLGVIFSSCSSDDGPNSISVSIDTIEFNSNGGEQQVNISSADSWIYQCNEDWLTIRKNQNGLRIIAEENVSSEERMATISIYINNSPVRSISIIQLPLNGFGELNELSIPFSASIYRFKHYYKEAPIIENSDDWCVAECVGDSIFINITKNYDLKSRETNIKLIYNNNVREITVIQAECPWFESFKMIPVEGGILYGCSSK